MKNIKYIFLTFVALLFVSFATTDANAGCKPEGCETCSQCPVLVKGCQNFCVCVSTEETGKPDKPETTIGHITEEFKKHRKWMVDIFFYDQKENDPPGLRAAMKLMTDQLNAIGMQQVQIIGTFFDAKHQLETQRLFQQLTARAHKDYHPNEELCEFGTATRSLASSFRNTDLTAAAIAKRAIERQLLTKDTVGNNGTKSDEQVRLTSFVKKYCNPLDNAGNLDLLCKKSEGNSLLYNKDINYTATIETPLTLDLDFSSKGQTNTDDENALFALTSNLFAHELFPSVNPNDFIERDGTPDFDGAAQVYQDLRAVTAKRSVATNSLASIAALKTKGDTESQPFIYALIKEMGGDNVTVDEIKELLGDRPSYYAQMEILTKKLYQNPNFYAELYDKPANVIRKDVAIQAATLMQKRDLYRSYLRSEMVLAIMLETALADEQMNVTNERRKGRAGGKGRTLGR